MELRGFALSAPGPDQEVNEDFIHLDPEAGIFVVADGMGGRPGGDTASRIATERFVELCTGGPGLPDDEGFLHIIAEVNGMVRDAADADPALTGMGSTLSAVVINGDRAAVVHVGDSRIFLFREEDLCQLTTDHTVEVEFRREAPDASVELNPQVAGMLTRAIGTEEGVEPEILHLEFRTGDSLLLVSDGIGKVLTTMEIQEACRSLAAESAETTCTRLFQVAQDKKPMDDTTLGVVKILDPPT